MTPSLQVAIAHTPAVHTPEAQSLRAPQTLPAAHGVQLPPQSTSDSLPFFLPSLQLGAAQMPAVHTIEVQSLAPRHLRLGAQGPQAPPPQSTSLSLPFLI